MVFTRVYKPPQFFWAFPMHKKQSNSKLCCSTMIIARVAASRDDSSNVHPPSTCQTSASIAKEPEAYPKPTPTDTQPGPAVYPTLHHRCGLRAKIHTGHWTLIQTRGRPTLSGAAERGQWTRQAPPYETASVPHANDTRWITFGF